MGVEVEKKDSKVKTVTVELLEGQEHTHKGVLLTKGAKFPLRERQAAALEAKKVVKILK